MFGRLKKKLFMPLTKVCYVDGIYDKNFYEENKQSYAGGSLEDSNVLVLSNDEAVLPKLNAFLKREKCYSQACDMKKIHSAESFSSCNNLIGPFDHVINIVKMDKCDTLLTSQKTYNGNDILHQLYHLLQMETDYLVQNDRYATLTTAFQSDGSIEGDIISEAVAHLLNGLSKPLSNHHLVENGLVATVKITEDTIIKNALFLASKYGQVMAGETMKLK